jgi:HSP20 family protein
MANIILRNMNDRLPHSLGDSCLWPWDPLGTLNALLSATEGSASTRAVAFAPRFDIKENQSEYVLTADLPGVKPEAVELSLLGAELRVSGRREASPKEETDKTYLTECSYGSFSRAFTLPDDVDGEKVGASLKDGVLTVSFPKKPETQPRKIQVNVGETKA